jgi:uncharacterized protein YjiK
MTTLRSTLAALHGSRARRRGIRRVALLGVALATSALPGVAAALSLADYAVTGRHALPAATAAEASAVTWNWDTNTLFVLGDEGDALAEVGLDGSPLGFMTLTGFADTEGLAYVGGDRFVLTEERLQDAYQLTYSAGGTVDGTALPSADLGPTVGNIGIEGISLDRRDGRFVTVKETGPQEVRIGDLAFGSPGSASMGTLFDPTGLAVLDLSDVSVLSGVTALAGTPGADDLLIFSQASARLLHVTRTGALLGSFDFSGFALDAEGVTIDANGTIYVVAESGSAGGAPTLFVLTAVPEPGTAMLVGLGLAGLATGRRRRA